MKALLRFSLAVFAFGLLAACSKAVATPAPAPTAKPLATTLAPTSAPPSPAPTATPATAATPVNTATPSSAATAAPATNAAEASVPSSCSAIQSLVATYTGGVATTKSLGSPQHLSCEFADANASHIVIVNIGVGGTAAAFDALRATSGQGGRTVMPISGLGVSAFSVSKNNMPAGVAVLTAQGLVYDVNSNLPLAQDEALIKQLMALA